MAFLDNSGDIILDAVLTDAGRKRLAAGDGSFKIAKFALGDDEVDYSLYTPVTSSGYEDLRILQLPIFEAFTNNTSVLKNKLLTYADNSLLYLPVVKLNNVSPGFPTLSAGGYNVAVDATTVTNIKGNNADAFRTAGYRYAQDGADDDQSKIVLDQGLDSSDLALGLLSDTQRNLMETQYIIEVDNRLLQIATGDGTLATPTFIDDDSVASYYLSMNSNPDYFLDFVLEPIQGGGFTSENKVIGPTANTGRLGSRLKFNLRASLDLQVNTSLFTQLGKTGQSIDPGGGPLNFSTIDTIIRITGFTTGYRTDVPLKLLKSE
ncbi:MAG: hypothetical protein NZ811_03095 [Gammaproteobacteria bacterium]|nr:hypothetical protein [Gammaproteobacteria bacterium]